MTTSVANLSTNGSSSAMDSRLKSKVALQVQEGESALISPAMREMMQGSFYTRKASQQPSRATQDSINNTTDRIHARKKSVIERSKPSL
jgi:hypothetical protein